MFKKHGFFLLCGLLMGLFSLGCDNTPVTTDKAKLRIVHLSYDGPAVDVMIGENKPISNLKYKAGSAYIETDAGKELTIKIFETGKTDKALAEIKQTLTKDKNYTIVAVGKAAEISAMMLEDDNAAPTAGKVKIRVFHGSPDAPNFDVKVGKADAEKLFTVAYKSTSGYKEVDPTDTSFVLTEEGKTDAAAIYKAIKLEAGRVYTIFANGTFDTTDQVAFGLRAFVDNGDGAGKDNIDLEAEGGGNVDKAKLRILHMSYDGPSIDVTVNDATPPAVKSLAYGDSSGYLDVSAGKPVLKVTETGKTEPVLLNTSPDIEKGKSYTVIAYKETANIETIVVQDDLVPAGGKAKLRVIHAANASSLDFKIGAASSTPLFASLKSGGSTAYKQVDAGKAAIFVTEPGTSNAVLKFQEIDLEAGKIYTAVIRGTADDKDAFSFGVRLFTDNDDGKSVVDLIPAGDAYVRVLHMSYDGPSIDVIVKDGATPAISNLPFGESSGYTTLPSGKTNIKVTEAGKKTPSLIDTTPDLKKDASYTFVAFEKAADIKAFVVEDARETVTDKAKIRVIHAADAPTVDIKAGTPDSQPLFGNVEKGKGTAYIEVAPGKVKLIITAAGDTKAIVTFQEIDLEAGKVYTAVAHGTLDENDAFAFGVRVFTDNDEGKTFADLQAEAAPQKSRVLVVHASPDAPSVDLFIDDTKINTSPLDYPNNTGYLDLDAGKRKIDVKSSADNTVVPISTELDFEAGKSYSFFAVNVLASIEPLRLEDDLTAPAAGKAHVRFVHLSPDTAAIDVAIKGGATLFTNSQFKDASAFTPIDANTYDLEVKLNQDSSVVLSLDGVQFEDGKIYTVFARGLTSGSNLQALGAEIIVHNP
ncbi:MAG: DUF4397 domain-containing protein [Myxococcales bacterium]|nr:DUF4397 domain-containing protein [Myxococcales bacterium]